MRPRGIAILAEKLNLRRDEETWRQQYFRTLSSTKTVKFIADKDYRNYLDDDIRWITLTQNVNIANETLLTDDNVDIFKDHSVRITSRFENGPPGIRYGGFCFDTGPGKEVGTFMPAERGRVTAIICGEYFEADESIEIRKDRSIYVDGVNRTPAFLLIDLANTLRPPEKEVAKTSEEPAEQKVVKYSKEVAKPAVATPAKQTAQKEIAKPSLTSHDEKNTKSEKSSVAARLTGLFKKTQSLAPSNREKKPEKSATVRTPQEEENDKKKWLEDMQAMVARAGNVSDICIGTSDGRSVKLSNVGTLTTEDILNIENGREYNRKRR